LGRDYDPHDDLNPFVLSHCTFSQFLNGKFAEFNRAYFEGLLPKFEVLVCSKPKNFGHEAAGYCLKEEKTILIRDGLGTLSTLQTLTHEMIHAKLSEAGGRGKYKIHGPLFLGELKRLRRLGAPLSPLDVDVRGLDNSPSVSIRAIQSLIKEARDVERLPKRDVPQFLEYQLEFPYSVLRRRFNIDRYIHEMYRSR
jgi:hypothetical protein